MNNAVILGSGSYAPDRVLPNSYFNELLGEDVGTWLEQNVQIYERRWCRDDESTSDLCLKAAQKALTAANVAPEELNLIIVATDTPEYISPSTASKLQYQLGAVRSGAFDLNSACAGFVTALDVAAKYIRADEQYQKVLVVGAYAMSKHLNKRDKKTVTLFADGAGAVVLGATADTDRGFIASQLIAQGQYCDWMGIYAGGTRQPVTEEVLQAKTHQLQFVKKFPIEVNPDTWTAMIQQLSQRIGVQPADVQQYFITQLNINSIWETLGRLNLPKDKAHTIMQHYGYTGSACIPMVFDDAVRKGIVKQGDLVFFVGSGGGLSFASAAFRL